MSGRLHFESAFRLLSLSAFFKFLVRQCVFILPQVATLFGFVLHVRYVSSLSVNEFTSCFDALIQLVEDRTYGLILRLLVFLKPPNRVCVVF